MQRRLNRNHQMILFSIVCALLACSVQFDILGEILSTSSRMAHFALSACLLLVATLIHEDSKTFYLPEIGAVLLLGLLKEMIDPSFDFLDLTANFMGCTSALLLALALRLPAQPKKSYSRIRR